MTGVEDALTSASQARLSVERVNKQVRNVMMALLILTAVLLVTCTVIIYTEKNDIAGLVGVIRAKQVTNGRTLSASTAEQARTNMLVECEVQVFNQVLADLKAGKPVLLPGKGC